MNATVVSMQKAGTLQQSLVGNVVHEDQTDTVLVQCERGVVNASRAFSCLVRPIVNDKVLLAFSGHEVFVIAIISRDSDHTTLDFAGDVELTTKCGKISISANEQIMLSSRGAIHQVSDSNHVVCSTLEFQSEAVSLNAATIQSNSKQSFINSDTMTVTGTNFYQKVEQVVRWVSKLETVNINNWIQNIRNTLSSRSKNAVITAESDMKIDAERIHMG